MQYELQRVQEMNKAFVPLDTVTVMDTVLDYYESHGNNAEKMMANYMMGCVHRDRGNSPVALEYYRKATEYADTTNLSEVRTLSRIYGQIAEVFNRQRAPQLELKAEREAIRLSLKAKDSLAAVMYYEYLSGPYHMMDKMDSALLINQTAIAEFMKMGRMDLAAGVLPTAINIYLSQKKYKEAKLAMEQFEQYSGWFTGDGIAAGHEFYYYYKGLYYEGVERSDSALYYYRKLLHFSQMENLQAAYEGLARTYKEIGQADSAIKYAFLFAQANDSISLKSSSQEIVRTQALYDYSENQRLAAEKEQEAERLKISLYLIALTVVVLTYLIYFYIKRQQRKRMSEIASANAKYSELLSQYNKSQEEMSSLKRGYDHYQTEKQQEIEKLQQLLAVYQEDKISPEQWDIEHALLNSKMVCHLHQLASKAKLVTNAELEDLRKIVSEHLPDFYHQITSADTNLTDKEIIVSILCRLRFIPSEMTVLLGLTPQRITNIRSSINMKLFHEKSAQSLESNLRRF